MTTTASITPDVSASASEPESVSPCIEMAVAQPEVLAPLSVSLPELARFELQARILANQPADAIASRMGLPTDMVIAYETTELDVRSQLKHSSVVLHKIIGIPPTEEWSAADIEKFWMWLGYTYGAEALDVAIPPYINLPPKRQELGLRAYVSPDCDVPEEFRILVAGKLTPIAATVTVPGRKLIGKLQKTTDRRVRPVDLLTSLSGLIRRPSDAAANRDEDPQPATFHLKEAA